MSLGYLDLDSFHSVLIGTIDSISSPRLVNLFRGFKFTRFGIGSCEWRVGEMTHPCACVFPIRRAEECVFATATALQ